MGPRTFNSYYRQPLQETDANLNREESNRSTARGWWPLKSFPANKRIDTLGAQQHFQALERETPGPSVTVAASQSVPVNAVVAQLGGGPLRAIHKIQAEPFTILVIEFFYNDDAQTFRNHVAKQRLFVYGSPLTLARLDAEQVRILHSSHPTTFNQMSRRTLEIFRPVAQSSRRPELIRCDVNQAYIMQIFSKIGAVLEVRPMIYQRYIAFAIDFASVESAIQAKHLFDEEVLTDRGLRLANPTYNRFAGLHQWSLEYSRDNAERHCFF